MTNRVRQTFFVATGIGLLALAAWLGLSRGPSLGSSLGSSLGFSLASFVDRESRPKGTLEDVIAFSKRDDTNVLFILVDTLRADHLSAYGYQRKTSPTIDALAADGIRFGDHISQSSWTKCSMASLWTGLYPQRTGVLRSPNVLPEAAMLPAEIYRDAGLRTAGIWRNGWIAGNFGFSQGFQTYTQPQPSRLNRPKQYENPHLTLAGSDADLVRSTFSFLRAYGHERWFLYLHMMDVHQYGFSEEEAVFGSAYPDLYDNSILWVDRLIGHVIDELETRGLRDRTLIVFASDHGEAFGEHGGEGHARDVYGEVTTTPFILSFPFRLDPGVVVDTRTANVDVWPTVLDLTGMTGPDDVDGRSRVPEIAAAFDGTPEIPREGLANDQTVPAEELIFSFLDQSWGQDRRDPQPQVGINRGPWRLLYSSARPNDLELFDKLEDPGERRNVAAEHVEVADALKELALEHLQGEPPWGPGSQSIEIDDMQRDQLRALGYGVQ